MLEICKKYPEYIFIVINTKSPKLKINKHKFMVKDMTISIFIKYLRNHKYIEINEHQAIFIFVKNIIPRSTESLDIINQKYRDVNGILNLQIEIENTFG